jgi:xylose isomerase
MSWKFCANASFFGLRRDRFTEYQPQRSLAEKVKLVSQVPGIRGIELKYPGDFQDMAQLRRLLHEHNLELVVVNVDTKDVSHFRHGALSARQPEARQAAIGRLCDGMDIAAELGAKFVTTCPLADGHDYPFQVDHVRAWEHFIDSLRQVVRHRPEIVLLLEYQPYEMHGRVMLDTVGKVLHVCAEVGASNLGANLDIGHSLAAQESPAEAAALLASKNRLFYIHSNDNTGDGGDWDMASGTVHFWHWVELLHTLRQIGYEGWIGGDVAAKHFGPVPGYSLNTMMIQRMTRLLDGLDADRLAELMSRDGNTAEMFDYLTSFLADVPAAASQRSSQS